MQAGLIDEFRFPEEPGIRVRGERRRRRRLELLGAVDHESADLVPVGFRRLHITRGRGLPGTGIFTYRIFRQGPAHLIVIGGGPGQDMTGYFFPVSEGMIIYSGRDPPVPEFLQDLRVECLYLVL